jgi:hypothetical protein
MDISNEKNTRANTKPEEKRGLMYIELMSKYMGVFICFGSFPIDFPLAKVIEVFLAGCLAIIEPKKFLFDDYGLIPFEHYIPLLIDKDEKLILDIKYYEKYLGTHEGEKIAKNGFEHIINNFTDSKIAEKYIEILKNI